MIYQNEIDNALMWLFKTQNKENFGWSWVRDISPNAQNTAEVVYSCSLFVDRLSDDQKQLINEAVSSWLLLPQKHAVLTIDWVWIGYALLTYKNCFDKYNPEFDVAFVTKDINICIDNLLSLQNPDGGWGDHKNDLSTMFRTALVSTFLIRQDISNNDTIKVAIKKACTWILGAQNDDGGFGNIKSENMSNSILECYSGIQQDIVESQYLSSLSATGYALIAISSYNRHIYHKEIKHAIEFLKNASSNDKYEIFYEVGIRKNTLFTFRHFGAAWMGIGLLSTGHMHFTSPEILNLVKHFLKLQDRISGGFKCESSSDVYTWSNCNALMFLYYVITDITKMNGIDYTDIIAEYYMQNN